jgi:phage portal protein BeeE
MDPSEFVHIPLYTLPGKVAGLSPLTQFRLTIELGLQAQDFSINWYRNGAFPGGILRNKRRIVSDEDAAKGKKRFKAATANRDMFVTGNDWEFTPITISADDAAFVASAKLNAGMIAAVYGVDPEDIGGEAANSLTYATVEQKGIRFTQFPLRPLAIRLEDAITDLHPKPQFAKFNLDALVRADVKTRTEVEVQQLRAGILTNPEVRAIEDKPPLTAEQLGLWHEMYPPQASKGDAEITVGTDKAPVAAPPVAPAPAPAPKRDDAVVVNVRNTYEGEAPVFTLPVPEPRRVVRTVERNEDGDIIRVIEEEEPV